MAVSDWLRPVPRSTPYSFKVVDLEEISPVPTPAVFAGLLRDAYLGQETLADVADRYGFAAVKAKLLAPLIPVRENAQRGDFGEAVTVEILETLEGFHVPINKLAYKITADQSLPGPDCLAFKLSQGELEEVAYVEAKLRTTRDALVAVNGVRQLEQVSKAREPELLTFVLRRLRDKGDVLANIVETYVFGRNDSKDRYLLSVLYENDHWGEGILERLEDEGIGLEPLVVYVTRIAQLRSLVDETYAELKAEAQSDGH